MDLARVDLKLLVARALLAERSVTKAARRLGLAACHQLSVVPAGYGATHQKMRSGVHSGPVERMCGNTVAMA